MGLRCVGLTTCVICGSAVASTDTLVAGVQSASFGGATAQGMMESVDWLRQDAQHQLIGLGTTREDFAGARLSIARMMGAVNLLPGLSVSAIAEGGPAAQGASQYTFVRQTLEATTTMSARMQFSAGGQYVAADAARTVLVRTGLQWSPAAAVSLHLQLGHSVGGNLPTRYAVSRVDYLGRFQLYGGAATGTGAQSITELGRVSYQRYYEGFVGAALPLSRCLVGVSWDWLSLDTVRRRTVGLNLTVPLRGGG